MPEDDGVNFDIEAAGNLPTHDIADYLSGENMSNITLERWLHIYRQAKELQKNKQIYQNNIAEKSSSFAIPYTEIDVSPGVPWVSQDIISDFVHFLRTGNNENVSHFSLVSYEPITGNWFVYNKKTIGFQCDDVTRIEHTYGLKNYNALYILEATLNLREIKIMKNRGKEYDENSTIIALEKQEDIMCLFKRWIFADEERRWEVEKAYNAIFGKFAPKTYNGRSLAFPEMSENVVLYDYQKDAIQKIMTEKNTLLAFDVGSGKTYIMIAAAMKMRQSGCSRRNMFVVPNNIVGQWALLFEQMYPKAKVLAVEPKSFKPEMRSKMLTQIKNGDYDGIIIAYSCFEQIPLSSTAVLRQTDASLEEINQAIKNYPKYDHRNHAALLRKKKYIRNMMNSLLDELDEGENASHKLTFDELDIDTLFVDEAHNFKNVPIKTNLKTLRGINTRGSEKCLSMLQKVRFVQGNHDGGGVVFATGTPLCNSIADAYTLQMYLQYDVLKEHQLDKFDNWVKTFAKPARVCEIDVDTSKFRFVHRFAKFFNLPQLSKIFSDIAVFYTLNSGEDLPTFERYDEVLIARNKNLVAYMGTLCNRAEKIRAKEVKSSDDNMLKISTDGRKAALDLRLVDTHQPVDEFSKVYQCADRVFKIYKENSAYNQIVFCDYSTPKNLKFNIYHDMQARLIERGIPSKEIAFIHSYHSEAKKVQLYEDFNEGKIRVLIGSTFKLGIGTNVQKRLKAIHHLDIPWRPSDVTQREGRILRKGNRNEHVRIFRYICEGSFDAYSWQILETKQRFISQFLMGTSNMHSISDLEENILSYAQVKALAIAEPLMKDLAEKQNELIKLQIVSSSCQQGIDNMQKELEDMEDKFILLKKRCKYSHENLKYLQMFCEGDYKSEYARTKNLLTREAVNKIAPCEASFLGFQVVFPDEQNEESPFVFLERLQTKYWVAMGNSPAGNARRIANILRKFDVLVIEAEEQKDKLLKKKEDYERELGNTHSFAQQKSVLEAEIRRLQLQIRRNAN